MEEVFDVMKVKKDKLISMTRMSNCDNNKSHILRNYPPQNREMKRCK